MFESRLEKKNELFIRYIDGFCLLLVNEKNKQAKENKISMKTYIIVEKKKKTTNQNEKNNIKQ